MSIQLADSLPSKTVPEGATRTGRNTQEKRKRKKQKILANETSTSTNAVEKETKVC